MTQDSAYSPIDSGYTMRFIHTGTNDDCDFFFYEVTKDNKYPLFIIK